MANRLLDASEVADRLGAPVVSLLAVAVGRPVSDQVGAGVLGLPTAKHHQSLRVPLPRADLRTVSGPRVLCHSPIEGSGRAGAIFLSVAVVPREHTA